MNTLMYFFLVIKLLRNNSYAVKVHYLASAGPGRRIVGGILDGKVFVTTTSQNTGISTIFFTSTKAYVYLQVRKGDNHSDVDALIHKVIPKKHDTAANSRRKVNVNRRVDSRLPLEEQLKDLESLVLAINTGANSKVETIKPSIAQNVQNLVKNFVQDESFKAFFRANKENYIKPEIVHFKSDKPSLMLEVNFESIIKGINEVLASKEVRQYAETLGKNAAIIYQTLMEESRKDNSKVEKWKF